MKKLTALFHASLALVALAAPTLAQGPLATSVDLRSFHRAWKIVDQQHFDPTFNGVDWDAVLDDYRPRAEAAPDRAAMRAVVRAMLAELGQSHFALIDQESLRGGERSTNASPPGTAGFDVRIRDGRAIVVRVDAGGPAEIAGVRPGWLLAGIDGDEVAELLDEADPATTLREETIGYKTLLPRLGGEIGSAAFYDFEDGEGEEHTLELTRVERDAVPFDLRGLPRFYLEVRSAVVEHDGLRIGMVFFSNWFDGIKQELDRLLVDLRDCDGILIDLRGNSGGDARMAQAVAGHFFDETALLGVQRTRRGDVDLVARPRTRFGGRRVEPFAGPLAILTDETTGSCSEVFTGGMQALGRAHVVGERTVGAALPATLTRLPNGDFLLHAISDFRTSLGDSLEGDGVRPDVPVALDRAALLAGRDPVLESAATWIAGEVRG
jgi:carboxyl-terminal processing protease